MGAATDPTREQVGEPASASPSLAQFATLVRQYKSPVCAAAYAVTGDRALSEDIAQETFLVAWRSHATLRDPAKLSPWLRGIARNLAHKARRKRAAVEELGDAVAADDPAHDAVARDEARATWAAMRKLPEAYREALVLYYWEDQSARQVAEALGISEATAMQRLSRGRALLRDEVGRLIERTLRRARPGAALTAAIVAAVTTAAEAAAGAAASGAGAAASGAGAAASGAGAAASGAGAAASGAGAAAPGGRAAAPVTRAAAPVTRAAAPVTRGPTAPGRGVSRRMICKTGAAVAALQALGGLGAPIAVPAGRRGEGRPEGSPNLTDETAASPRDPSGAGMLRDSPAGSPEDASQGEDPMLVADELDPGGEYCLPSLTSRDDLADSVRGRLFGPLSACFAEELVHHPCRIDVEVQGGAIARATIVPFDGASRRVIVRTVDETPSVLTPSEARAWLAGGNQITATPERLELADHDKAMALGEIMGLCVAARLEGVAVRGPDGVRHLQFGWTREFLRRIDWQAYLDLDVAAGASRGPASAPVTVVSFVDPADAWGFTGKVLAAGTEVLAKYPDDVRLVVKLCPLDPERAIVAEAAYAAHAQGALWPMLELLAAKRGHLALEDLVRYAAALGLDASRFQHDLDHHAFLDAVDRDQDHMVAMEIDALPSALVNGRRVHGALPVQSFVTAVERALRDRSRASR